MSQTTSLVSNRPPTKKASWGQGWVDLGYFECDVTSKPSFAHSDGANSHPTSPFQLQSFMRRLSGLQTRSHDTRLYSHSRTTKNSVVKVRHHSSWSAPCASTLINQYYNTLSFQNAVIVSIRNVQLQSNSLWGYHLKCEDLTDRSRKSNRNCLFWEEVPKHLLFGRELIAWLWCAFFHVASNSSSYTLSSVEHTANLGRFTFVRTARPDHSRRDENFTFNQNYPARSVQS